MYVLVLNIECLAGNKIKTRLGGRVFVLRWVDSLSARGSLATPDYGIVLTTPDLMRHCLIMRHSASALNAVTVRQKCTVLTSPVFSCNLSPELIVRDRPSSNQYLRLINRVRVRP